MNDWVGTDQFRREELNANFRALDAKAKEHDDSIGDLTALGTTEKGNLVEAVNEVTTSLAQMATQFVTLLDDVDATYKKDNTVDISKIAQLNAINFGKFYRKLQTKLLVNIECIGDSLTYGLDTTSVDRVGNQASTTYPQALQNRLRDDLWWNANVINKGVSGDTAQTSYGRNLVSTGNDCTILMIGTNDANAGLLPEDFLYYLEQMVIRKVLQGSCVILLSPPRTEGGTWDAGQVMFGEFIRTLALRYNIPFVNTQELMSRYSGTIFSDDTHYNGVGYNTLGTRLASIFYGNPYAPKLVGHGDVLLTRVQQDRVKYNKDSGKVTQKYAVNGVVPETQLAKTTGEAPYLELANGGNLYYPIYTSQDNLIVLPNFKLNASSKVKIQIDFGIQQADNAIDNVVYADISATPSQQNEKQIGTDNFWVTDITKEVSIDYFNNIGLVIPTKGWHIIKISSIGTGVVDFRGLSFMDFDILTSVNRYKNGGTFRKGVSTASLTSTVNLKDLRGIFYYNYETIVNDSSLDIPFKVTLYNNYQSVIEYLVVIGGGSGNVIKLQELRRTNIAGTPNEKTLSAVSVDRTTNVLTLTFAGSTTVASNYLVQPL